MNTIQLNQIMKYDNYSKELYLGTFAIDTIPCISKYPSCLIINNQTSIQNGQHWIAIFFNSNKTAEFFDSYGNPPIFYGLNYYINKYSSTYIFNHKQVQSINSSNCGYYCVLFLLFKSRGLSMETYLSHFKDSNLNDKMLDKLKKQFNL